MSHLLLQVQTEWFTAGAETEGGRVVWAAPVLAWSVGRPLRELAAWVTLRHGMINVVERIHG